MKNKLFGLLSALPSLDITNVHSLSLNNSLLQRKNFLIQGASAVPAVLSLPQKAPAVGPGASDSLLIKDHDYEEIKSLLGSKAVVPWSTYTKGSSSRSPFLDYRYRASSLSSTKTTTTNTNTNIQTQTQTRTSPPPASPTHFPPFMEGYWTVSYKFKGATFPQGRKILSLRTAGAGLGTCLSLPNVGYNPPPFSVHYFSMNDSNDNDIHNNNNNNNGHIYEDLAYNMPRLFEAFWSESKVLAVQTNGYDYRNAPEKGGEEYILNNIGKIKLSPKCFVNGDGCTQSENPNLHLPASRFAMDFEGPTRRSGRLIQSSDITMVDAETSVAYQNEIKSNGASSFVKSASYVQYNINQDLQTFFREITFLEKKTGTDSSGNTKLGGMVRVAAFLPTFIKEMDGSDVVGYDESNAVALYDYEIKMMEIDKTDAMIM